MADRHPINAFVDLSISLANVVTALMIIGALVGASVIFADAFFGKGAFDLSDGWVCLGVAAFVYFFRRVYPPVWRHIWDSFK